VDPESTYFDEATVTVSGVATQVDATVTVTGADAGD